MKTLAGHTLTVTLLLALAAIPAASSAHDQRGQRAEGPGQGFMVDLIAARLDLTDAQRDSVRAIHEGSREELEALQVALETARGDLREAIHAEPLDETAIRAAAARVASVEADLAVLRGRTGSEVRQILTPEQVEQAREMRDRFQDFRHGMHSRGHRGGRPRP